MTPFKPLQEPGTLTPAQMFHLFTRHQIKAIGTETGTGTGTSTTPSPSSFVTAMSTHYGIVPSALETLLHEYAMPLVYESTVGEVMAVWRVDDVEQISVRGKLSAPRVLAEYLKDQADAATGDIQPMPTSTSTRTPMW